jgi:1-pyrroline-5-carboxylate dehydrogenase
MQNAKAMVPKPINEPVLSYAPGTPERAALKSRIKELKSQEIEIPIIIGAKKSKRVIWEKCAYPTITIIFWGDFIKQVKKK